MTARCSSIVLSAVKPHCMLLLYRFKLGHSAPKMDNFKSFKDSERTDDAMVAVECDVNWHSQSDVRLRIKPIPKQLTFVPTTITTALSNLVSFQVCVTPCLSYVL